jgi:hypothetical protein
MPEGVEWAIRNKGLAPLIGSRRAKDLTEASFLPQDEPLQFYLTKTVGNSFYHAVELNTQLAATNLKCPPPADPNHLAMTQGTFNSRPWWAPRKKAEACFALQRRLSEAAVHGRHYQDSWQATDAGPPVSA